MTASVERAQQDCRALADLIDKYRDLGGDPAKLLNEPILLFEIDGPATKRAGKTVYKPTDAYRKLWAALRRRIATETRRRRR